MPTTQELRPRDSFMYYANIDQCSLHAESRPFKTGSPSMYPVKYCSTVSQSAVCCQSSCLIDEVLSKFAASQLSAPLHVHGRGCYVGTSCYLIFYSPEQGPKIIFLNNNGPLDLGIIMVLEALGFCNKPSLIVDAPDSQVHSPCVAQ